MLSLIEWHQLRHNLKSQCVYYVQNRRTGWLAWYKVPAEKQSQGVVIEQKEVAVASFCMYWQSLVNTVSIQIPTRTTRPFHPTENLLEKALPLPWVCNIEALTRSRPRQRVQIYSGLHPLCILHSGIPRLATNHIFNHFSKNYISKQWLYWRKRARSKHHSILQSKAPTLPITLPSKSSTHGIYCSSGRCSSLLDISQSSTWWR